VLAGLVILGDLSIQGKQRFPLVASNLYEVGEATVEVLDDAFAVTYRMYHHEQEGFTTQTLSEFITFYQSYADVGIVEPEEMPGPSAFAFDTPYSIQEHLGGDDGDAVMLRRARVLVYIDELNGEYTLVVAGELIEDGSHLLAWDALGAAKLKQRREARSDYGAVRGRSGALRY